MEKSRHQERKGSNCWVWESVESLVPLSRPGPGAALDQGEGSWHHQSEKHNMDPVQVMDVMHWLDSPAVGPVG